jgi:putative FmdB family regulatory protein
MPNYEYQCPHCKAESEQFFPIVDGPSPSVVCSGCGKEASRKFSSFAIQLKGGGWGGQ